MTPVIHTLHILIHTLHIHTLHILIPIYTLCVYIAMQQAYQEAMKGFTESGSGLSLKDRGQLNRDDRVHGSLLIMIELFMNCVLKAEVII